MTQADDILYYWFGPPGAEDSRYEVRRKLWFGKSEATDQEIRDRFLPAYQQAAAGDLDSWQDSPQTCLALIVLLDQFPRNLFRGTPQAFATDSRALTVAKGAIARQFDHQLLPLQRLFVYLPLEHSENLADQHQCVTLMQQAADISPELADAHDYAIRHLRVIDQFGRFPHRNAILGRKSTPEEVEFLKQPGSSF
jgi:uncharacterized protein (DUF924 family)